MQVWILTFNRPTALNRLIQNFGQQGYRCNIFSNYPEVQLTKDNHENYVDSVIVNTLNSKESNSWCARSWNAIMLRAFDQDDEAILIQDDTDISPTFGSWFEEQKQKYDFMWGPAGDQWHFIRKDVLKKVGWWDERYIGCYCGDAEYVKRVYHTWDKDRISVEDSHNWGFVHNASGISQNIITTYDSKVTANPGYENQHWEFERINKCNPTLAHSQGHFRRKWNIDLDNNRPVIESWDRQLAEIDWYPWFSKKHGFTAYDDNQSQG